MCCSQHAGVFLFYNTEMTDKKLVYANSDELCEKIADMFGTTIILKFSRGKDSIAAWLQCRRYFKIIIPVFQYLIPHMKFEDDSLDYYEQYFGTRIVRVPHPSLYRMLNNWVFQSHPYQLEFIEEYNLVNFDYEDLLSNVKEDYKLPEETYTAIGLRVADNLVRRTSIRKNGAYNPKTHTFYPIYDWSMDKLIDAIKAEKVYLPIDYKLIGKSFDGFQATFVQNIKKSLPDDFERIKKFFPLVEADMWRHEFRRRRIAAQGATQETESNDEFSIG